MAITRNNPNTIFLGGDRTIVGDLAANTTITPGMLIERDDVGAGVIRWKLATADLAGSMCIAQDMPYANKGVDDTYAAADIVDACILHKGGTAWCLIGSGQNIAAGDLLGSAGSGLLKSGATVALCRALENKPTVTVTTRIRVEAI